MRIGRRDFITLVGAAAAWPLSASAQQPALPVIGFLNSQSAEPYAARLVAFRKGLNEIGFVESKNLTIEYRFAEGQFDRLPALAADLVRRQVAVIVASGGSPAAAKAATTTTPIVFVAGADPVKSGLVASLARPGGNLTGVTSFTGELGAKRLGILHELLPGATAMALLVNPTPNREAAQALTNEMQLAAHAIGLQLLVFNASTERDLDAAFESVSRNRTAALMVDADAFFLASAGQLIGLAARHAVPTIFPWRESAEAGGLISYSTSESDVFRNAGLYTGRILKGEKPADLPVLLPTKFEFVINLKTAKTLRLEVPVALSARADEIIE